MADKPEDNATGGVPQDLPASELDRLTERWLEHVPSILDLHPEHQEFTIGHQDLQLLTKLFVRLMRELGEKGYFVHITERSHHPEEKDQTRLKETLLNPHITEKGYAMTIKVTPK